MMEHDRERYLYHTGFSCWRAREGQFALWSCWGLASAADKTLQLDAASAERGADPYIPGSYAGRNFYNGGEFFWGEAESELGVADVSFSEAILSWSAVTPPGTWIEPLMRIQIGPRWSPWYSFGVWAEDYSTIQRH